MATNDKAKKTATPQRRRYVLFVLGGVLGALAIILFVIYLLFPLLFPGAMLLRATAKTAALYRAGWQQVAEETGLGQTAVLLRSGQTSQRLALSFAGGEDDSSGLALNGRVLSDIPARQLEASLQLEYRHFPLGTARFYGQGDLAAAEAPGLLHGCYGLHTESIGADFNASSLSRLTGLKLAEDTGFSLFAPAELLTGASPLVSEAGRRQLLSATWNLLRTARVERAGHTELATAGRGTRYHATLEQQALRLFVREAGQHLLNDECFREATGGALLAGGLALAIGQGEEALLPDPYLAAEGALDRLAALLGDAQCVFTVADGQLARLEVELYYNGHPLLFTADFGAAQARPGALTLKAALPDVEYEMELSGLAMQEGRFSPALQLHEAAGGQRQMLLDASAEYHPGKAGSNLRLSLESRFAPLPSLAAEGEAAALPDGSLQLRLPAVRLGGAPAALSLSYTLAPLGGHHFRLPDVALLLDATDAQLARMEDYLCEALAGLGALGGQPAAE